MLIHSQNPYSSKSIVLYNILRFKFKLKPHYDPHYLSSNNRNMQLYYILWSFIVFEIIFKKTISLYPKVVIIINFTRGIRIVLNITMTYLIKIKIQLVFVVAYPLSRVFNHNFFNVRYYHACQFYSASEPNN